MKSQLFTFLALLLLTSFSTHTSVFIHTNTHSKEALVIDLLHDDTNKQEFFFHACFDVPRTLDYACTNKLPTVIFVPQKLHGFSPLDGNGIWIEGVRTALTWASIFFRCNKKTDLTIIEIDTNISSNTIKRTIETLLNNRKNCNRSDIRDHFLSLGTLVDSSSSHTSGIWKSIAFKQEEHHIRQLNTTFQAPSGAKKRYLITGAAGFIGSHLAQSLLNQGHQVIGVDNFSCCSRENIRTFLNNPNFCFFEHDITQPIELDGELDYIVHLASIPSPQFYYRMPHETMSVGLHGTRNMLDLAVKKSATFLFSSTSEVYGDPKVSPQDETYPGNVSPVGKRSQYDQSKRGAETLIKLYADTYNIDVRIARIFNTYGPNMHLNDGRVVTNFIRALLRHEPMTIYGDGMQTRSFSYIDDTLQGLLKLLYAPLPENLPIQERVVNIGNDQELTIAELAHVFNNVAPQVGLRPTTIEHRDAFDTTDPKQRKPNLQRAHHLIGYQPRTELISGLLQTLSYFQKRNV